MAKQLLPLFPLSFVLLPAMPLPLHIFEERYKEMMGDIIPTQGEFGVVLAKEDGIVSIGCSALVDRVINRYPDGRLDLLAVGQRRFRIASLDQEKAYLRAEVDYFNDEDVSDSSPELNRRATDALRLLLRMERPQVTEEPKIDRSRMSFQIAQFIYDLEKRQTVLGLRSEVERLEFLVKIIPEYIERQERIALAKKVGPQNGHAKGL
ncbi:MAG TPA: LON peptidase substrate-binding domain-containing protein [Bryobacteraceae bacterium]|jgi:ATP-dependent Lon protease|nr:LON peptidase substrate-binding domain-containing protein [Bryobacteraceae bacterium]